MIPSQRDGENSYYDELGVSPDATAQQIRDAFRLHVRLLHPDQHRDHELKRAAETRTRRLNHIYAVLSDAQRRREYDESLHPVITTEIIIQPETGLFQRSGAKLAWIGAIAFSVAALFWLASLNTAPPLPSPLTESSAGAPTGPKPATYLSDLPAMPVNLAPVPRSPEEFARLQSELRQARNERDAALAELDRVRNATARSVPAAPENESADVKPAATPQQITDPTAQTAVETKSAIPRGDRAPEHRMAGFWFYIRPAFGQINKTPSLYPPEFVEATIAEDGGALTGNLRARFQISDRAISPDVVFTFTGSQTGAQASGPWSGAGGSKGQVSLKLVSENSLQIDWTATQLGTQPGLTSGTATLTRKIE